MSGTVAWPNTIADARTTIRRIDGERVKASWIEEAEQAIAGRTAPCRLQDRLDSGDQGWWIIGDAEIVGALCGKIVELTDASKSKALIWTWLAIDARWRAYGFGGASVPLLEQAAAQAEATLALTPLPPDNGVALYFWLRLGYTPLRSVDVRPGDRPRGVTPDALWMQRPLNSVRSALPGNAEE